MPIDMREEMQNPKRLSTQTGQSQEFRFLEDIAIADVAFEAYGRDLPELFENCASALSETQVELVSVERKVDRRLSLVSEDREQLLFDFLNELIFLKDTEQFLAKRCTVTIQPSKHLAILDKYQLRSECWGETVDVNRHNFRVDVKAVTMHKFGIMKTQDGYKATVVLDV